MVFENVYEMITPPATQKKSWFVDWFDGDDLKAWWTKSDVVGTGTFAMDDAVDEGFKVTTGSSLNDHSGINLNNIHHYANDGAISISVWKADTTVNILVFTGLMDSISSTTTDAAVARADSVNSNFFLRTADASTASNSDTSIALDANFHKHELELLSASALHKMDGILEVTKTNNLPTIKLQPQFNIFARGTGTKAGNIRFLEAYNT